MKNLLLLKLLVMIIIFSSCNNNMEKKYAELEKANVELKKELENCKVKRRDLAPMYRVQIKNGVEKLYDCAINNTALEIPISWRFEEQQLKQMLDTCESTGVKEAIGIMAYPIVEPNTNVLKIALVPYYQFAKDDFRHYDVDIEEDIIGAYNFSAICPPASNCITNMDLIVNSTIKGAVGHAYKFKGDGVHK